MPSAARHWTNWRRRRETWAWAIDLSGLELRGGLCRRFVQPLRPSVTLMARSVHRPLVADCVPAMAHGSHQMDSASAPPLK